MQKDNPDQKLKKFILKAKKAIIILSLVVLVAFSYGIGWATGRGSLKFEQGYIPKIVNIESSTKDVDFSLFWQTWELIEKKYAGPVDKQKLLYGSIRGMVEALGDPYTAFMDPEETKNFEKELSGSFSGIGAEIGIKNNKLTIISPLEDSPAKKAGLKAGDIILKIDDKDTAGMPLDEAVSSIRGKEGTKVTLNILRNGWSEAKNFEIKRAVIEVKSVKWEIPKGDSSDIGYISISRFGDDTESLLKEAANEAVKKDVKGLILDLRNNPGGYLDTAVKVASEFLEEGVVVKEKQDGESEELKATGKGKLTNKDVYLVVLVNEGSASASEIVAGAIQDHKRGILIGEKTFGKGSVQEVENLSQGASMRITIAHWYTPNDRDISKQGLEPNIKVELTDDDFNNDKDPQLDRAIGWLKNKITE